VAALRASSDLFVGVTTWNSAAFLPVSLAAVRRMTDERTTRVMILDNFSNDATCEVARSFGAEVLRRRSAQSMALVDLFNASRSTYTLLIHADVVLLARDWLDVCARRLTGNIALVSPEDIGCGPYTRPWGKSMPESSFLLFRTKLARRTRITMWRQRFKLMLPLRAIDFNGDHITYNLPSRLREHDFDWQPMRVHVSPRVAAPIYAPQFDAPMWKPDFATYRYGLGNFYSLDGVITHYHNWFERALENVPDDSTKTLAPQSGGLPLAFIKKYTRNFIDDLERGALQLPEMCA
jgi:glycosyltransferase involved in cell wall biosynthesis